MGASKRADWREERRKRAWAVKHEGWAQKDIATALGVSERGGESMAQARASTAGSRGSRGGHHPG